jgi:hypothetical protein
MQVASTSDSQIEHHFRYRILSSWSWLSLITFLVMLSHQSDRPFLLNRYSPLVSITLFVLLTLFIMSRWLLHTLNTTDRLSSVASAFGFIHRRRWLQIGIFFFSAGVIILIWLYFLSDYPAQYAMLRAYLVLSIILFNLIALPQYSHYPFSIPFFLLVGGIFLLVMLLTAEYYPAVAHVDEAFVFSVAVNLNETGRTAPTIYELGTGPDVFHGKIFGIRAFAYWLSVTGYSLYAGRVFTVITLFLSSILLAWGASRLYDIFTGAVVFMLANFAFMQHIFIRTDSYAVFFLCLSVLLFSFARHSPHIIWHVLVGLSVGMVLDSSTPAFPFGIGYAVVYAVDYWAHLKQGKAIYRPFWGLAAGGILAILLFLLKFSATELGVSEVNANQSFLTLISINNFSEMFELMGSFLAFFIRNHALLIALAIISIIPLLNKNKAQHFSVNTLNANWITIFGVWLVCLLPVYQYFTIHYAAFGLPFLILLAAYTVTHQLQRQPPTQGYTAIQPAYILLIVWMGVRIAFNLISLPSSSLEDVVATGERIAPLLANDVTIVAAEPFYFGMIEQRGFVGSSIHAMKEMQTLSDSEIWEYIQPDAFIFSSNWLYPARTPAVETYMDTNAFALAGCWETRSYGRIELWTKPQQLLAFAPNPCEFVPIPRLAE